ncbi:MAG: nuclear transport factor 2 family protein [Gemmatimonadales bacterium]
MTDTTATDTRALGRQLVDAFGKGWEKAKVDAMLEVFTPEAAFLASPFESPLAGLEAIRGYWQDVPYAQSEITFTSGEIYAAGPWFSTEFRCVYRRRRTGEWVDARGAIFCETSGEKITEMRMYWIR